MPARFLAEKPHKPVGRSFKTREFHAFCVNFTHHCGDSGTAGNTARYVTRSRRRSPRTRLGAGVGSTVRERLRKSRFGRLLLRYKVGMVSICGAPGGGKLDQRSQGANQGSSWPRDSQPAPGGPGACRGRSRTYSTEIRASPRGIRKYRRLERIAEAKGGDRKCSHCQCQVGNGRFCFWRRIDVWAGRGD